MAQEPGTGEPTPDEEVAGHEDMHKMTDRTDMTDQYPMDGTQPNEKMMDMVDRKMGPASNDDPMEDHDAMTMGERRDPRA